MSGAAAAAAVRSQLPGGWRRALPAWPRMPCPFPREGRAGSRWSGLIPDDRAPSRGHGRIDIKKNKVFRDDSVRKRRTHNK